jgi:hypothetical protein
MIASYTMQRAEIRLGDGVEMDTTLNWSLSHV